MSSVPVEYGGCHGCSAASRIRPEMYVQKKVFEKPGENSPRFEALLQGNFAMERPGFPIAVKRREKVKLKLLGWRLFLNT